MPASAAQGTSPPHSTALPSAPQSAPSPPPPPAVLASPPLLPVGSLPISLTAAAGFPPAPVFSAPALGAANYSMSSLAGASSSSLSTLTSAEVSAVTVTLTSVSIATPTVIASPRSLPELAPAAPAGTPAVVLASQLPGAEGTHVLTAGNHLAALPSLAEQQPPSSPCARSPFDASVASVAAAVTPITTSVFPTTASTANKAFVGASASVGTPSASRSGVHPKEAAASCVDSALAPGLGGNACLRSSDREAEVESPGHGPPNGSGLREGKAAPAVDGSPTGGARDDGSTAGEPVLAVSETSAMAHAPSVVASASVPSPPPQESHPPSSPPSSPAKPHVSPAPSLSPLAETLLGRCGRFNEMVSSALTPPRAGEETPAGQAGGHAAPAKPLPTTRNASEFPSLAALLGSGETAASRPR